MSIMHYRLPVSSAFRNLFWVLVGHIIGELVAVFLFAAWVTEWWTVGPNATAQGMIDLSIAKTLDYQQHGYLGGAGLAFLSGILCNFLVVLGVVMGQTSTSTGGMMMGAPVGIGDWWLWDEIPVLLGNFVGGWAMLGLPLYFSHRTEKIAAESPQGSSR